MAKHLGIPKPIVSMMIKGQRPITEKFLCMFIAYLNHIRFDYDRIVFPDHPDYESVLATETGPETPAQFIKRFGWSRSKLADAIPAATEGRLDRILKGRPHYIIGKYTDIHIMGQIVKVMKLENFTDFPWQHPSQQEFAYRTDLLRASGIDVDNDDKMFGMIKDSLAKAETAKTEMGQ